MKWFIKALRHYADFSGRARCREYWMFALFNVIFSFAWVLIATIVYGAIFQFDELKMQGTPLMASLAWFVAFALPGLALTVRRLHDIGKSGWWIFISLIPLVGGIWLFVLMITGGNVGNNRYGPDPKQSDETYPEKARLTSAGITVIIVSVCWIVLLLLSLLYNVISYISSEYIEIKDVLWNIVLYNVLPIIQPCILLITGIVLLMTTANHKIKSRIRFTAVLLLILSVIIIVFNSLYLNNHIHNFKDFLSNPEHWSNIQQSDFIISILADSMQILGALVIAFFAISLLLSHKNRILTQIAALCLTVISIILIFTHLLIAIQVIQFYSHYGKALDILKQYFSLITDVLVSIAYIVLAYTFYPRKAVNAGMENGRIGPPD